MRWFVHRAISTEFYVVSLSDHARFSQAPHRWFNLEDICTEGIGMRINFLWESAGLQNIKKMMILYAFCHQLASALNPCFLFAHFRLSWCFGQTSFSLLRGNYPTLPRDFWNLWIFTPGVGILHCVTPWINLPALQKCTYFSRKRNIPREAYFLVVSLQVFAHKIVFFFLFVSIFPWMKQN